MKVKLFDGGKDSCKIIKVETFDDCMNLADVVKCLMKVKKSFPDLNFENGKVYAKIDDEKYSLSDLYDLLTDTAKKSLHKNNSDGKKKKKNKDGKGKKKSTYYKEYKDSNDDHNKKKKKHKGDGKGKGDKKKKKNKSNSTKKYEYESYRNAYAHKCPDGYIHMHRIDK